MNQPPQLAAVPFLRYCACGRYYSLGYGQFGDCCSMACWRRRYA